MLLNSKRRFEKAAGPASVPLAAGAGGFKTVGVGSSQVPVLPGKENPKPT